MKRPKILSVSALTVIVMCNTHATTRVPNFQYIRETITPFSAVFAPNDEGFSAETLAALPPRRGILAADPTLQYWFNEMTKDRILDDDSTNSGSEYTYDDDLDSKSADEWRKVPSLADIAARYDSGYSSDSEISSSSTDTELISPPSLADIVDYYDTSDYEMPDDDSREGLNKSSPKTHSESSSNLELYQQKLRELHDQITQIGSMEYSRDRDNAVQEVDERLDQLKKCVEETDEKVNQQEQKLANLEKQISLLDSTDDLRSHFETVQKIDGELTEIETSLAALTETSDNPLFPSTLSGKVFRKHNRNRKGRNRR